MRKFLLIISILAVVFVAGCSEKTETNKPVQKENIEAKTETAENVNKEDYSNLSQEELNSKLIEAIDEQDAEKVKNLLTAGADVNTRATDREQSTALIYAVKKKNANIVKLLIEAGADVNAKDRFNIPAIISAVYEKENTNIIQLLVDAGAEVNTKVWLGGGFPIVIASERGYLDIVNILLKAGAKDYLRAATIRGDVEAVESLIKNGADVNDDEGEGSGDTPLVRAVTNGHTEIVKLLLAAGADPNVQEYCGSVLTIAIRGCHLDIVKELIKADVDVNAEVDCSEGHGVEPGTDTMSPLSIAIGQAIENPACGEIVEELLKAGVEQSIKDEELLFAINEKANVLVNMLQKYGAKDTLFTTIARNDMEQFKKLLKKANSEDKNRALSIAISTDNIPALKDLIAAEADVNSSVHIESHDYTIFSYAAKHGNLEIVKILLETGIDPNYEKCDCPELDYQDANLDDQPLIMASAYGHLEIVEELLKAGAEPNTACKYTNGRPLELVCLWANPKPDEEICSKIREVLIKAGAKE